MNTDKLEIIRIPGVGGILLTLGFFGCIINGVDEKMILFSQCHFFAKKNLSRTKSTDRFKIHSRKLYPIWLSRTKILSDYSDR